MNQRARARAAPLAMNLILVVSLGRIISDEIIAKPQTTGQADTADAVAVCVLSGKVIDSDTGEPVSYFHLLHMKSNGALVEHLETDEQGFFQTTALRGSQRYFQFSRSGRGTYIIDWDRQRPIGSRPFRGVIKGDMTDLTFQVKLWPVKALTGKVLDASGKAAIDASVYLHCDVPAVKTDSAGFFRLQVAPTDRDFDLFAISGDMNQAALVHLEAGTTTSTIHLEPTVSYKGRVVDTRDQAIGPFKFILGMRLNGSMSDCLQEQIQTNGDGAFTLDYLYPKARYRAWWFPDEQINRTIGEHGEKILDLSSHKPGEPIQIVVEQYLNMLSGNILNAKGEPILGAKIMVITSHGIQAQHRRYKAVYSGEDGAFRLLNLADGHVLFNIYAEGYKSREVWAPTDANDLEIVMKSPSEPSTCKVWVTDDESRPITGAPLHLYFTLRSGERLASHTATTDAEGKAEFTFTPYDDRVRAYGTVCCDLEGYDLAYNSVSDSADSHVKFVLHETGEHWAGTIIDPERNTVSGAKLYMTSMSQRTRTPKRKTPQWLGQSSFSDQSERTLVAETNARGEFVLDRFNKEDFVRLMVKAAGFKRQEIDLTPERDVGTVFQLSSRAAIVKGLLVNQSTGEPESAAEIKLRAYRAPDRDVITDTNGSFVVDDLEPGEYVPVLGALEGGTDGGFVCVPETFVAEAGKTTEVTLKMQKGIPVQGRLIESSSQERPTARRIFLEARLMSGFTVASSTIAEDARWQLLLAPGPYDFHYSTLIEQVGRFYESERPLPVLIEDGKMYTDLILEMDGQGNLVMCPPSLKGQSLPDLNALGISSSPGDLTGKRLLVCFWDMNQRPSRHCMTQLAKQIEMLEQKGVVVVAVQASKVERSALDEWEKKHDIFLTSMVEGDAKKARFIYGVQSLPWLILIDRTHVVCAEGFPLSELDDQIEQLGDK
jgi:hypothetical protein